MNDNTQESAENQAEAPVLEHGVQPFDALMTEFKLVNHDVVAACASQLSHKNVMKARRGRHLTARMQFKIADAFNAALEAREIPQRFHRDELFNYKG